MSAHGVECALICRAVEVWRFADNEVRLAEKEVELIAATGNLGEMFGVVKQVSGQTRGEFKNSIIIVVILIYMVLVVMFNSLSKPFLVLSIIPFGLAGVIQ